MKEVCSCLAKFDTLEELYAHANNEMGTDYSPEDFEITPDMPPEEQQRRAARLSAYLSSPHHGFTMAE